VAGGKVRLSEGCRWVAGGEWRMGEGKAVVVRNGRGKDEGR